MGTRDFGRLAKRLALNMRRRRRQLGLTQEATAAELAMAPRRYQQIEAGEQNVTLDTLARISRVLKIAPRDLL